MSMITIEMMGGLGNQLFQIACVLSYSLKYKKPFILKINYQLVMTDPFIGTIY